MSDLEIPIRELHARTGHYVRKAAAQGRILVTHRGQPMAELRPLSGEAGPAEIGLGIMLGIEFSSVNCTQNKHFACD
ncbi:MAG: type II toxin-antitoxin system prevent-host-death family antitoxin [Opitutales bacterium]|nr:type II toxin-antitoxin system prevent-host-death family antitoxin [Opitutales bacterium]